MKRKLGRVSVRISETGSAEVHQTCDEFPLREEQSLVATLSLASYFAAGGAAIGEGAASFLSAMGVVIAGSGFVTKRDALNPTGVVVRRIPEADPLEPLVASGRVPADRPVRRQDKTGSWIVGLVPVPPLRADVHVTDGSLEVEWPAYLGQQRGLENPLRLVAALWAYADYTADQGRECLLGLAELVRRCRTQPDYLWASDGVLASAWSASTGKELAGWAVAARTAERQASERTIFTARGEPAE